MNYLNELLGNTKLFQKGYRAVSVVPLSTQEEIETLVDGMKSGKVGVVIHIDSNPIYHLPKEFGYEEVLNSVPISISLVETENETSRHCTFVLPINHSFESWGDYQVRNGILSFSSLS